MKFEATWTLGGDFLIVDGDDDGAPVAELKLHEPLKSLAIDNPAQVAAEILKALVDTPHPFFEEKTDE